MLADTLHPDRMAAVPMPLRVNWKHAQAIVNVRGDPADPLLLQALSTVVGLPWPLRASETPSDARHRVLWAGPDDWFVMGAAGTQESLAQDLRQAAGGRHHAVTDVSSGYAVLALQGAAVRDVLAQGCPLDLHPRVFTVGQSAGTHFFKASVWLWRTRQDAYELLVRSSFVGYVDEVLRRCTLECGIDPG